MHKTLLFLIFLISYSIGFGQDISFYKENITMKIEKDYFYVTGNYYLKTNGDKLATLVYPFQVDSLMGEVDSIYIFNLTANEPVEPLSNRRDGIVFRADFGDNTELLILISYRQKLSGNRAEYILESTIGWRKPLDQADYQLIIPDNLKVVRFSIPPDESILTDTERIYYWSKTDYMPTGNMVFEFIDNK
ncbi:MAG: hypothetical protein M0Q51_02900 [Bacteroidales bacterium]|nr:hypothetical protein [Bacteroidales bacterium]